MTLCDKRGFTPPPRKKGKNMAKKKQNENRDEVLVIKSTPVSDDWETDADRIPLCVISQDEAIKSFWAYGYEIYTIRKSDGNLTRIKEWWEE